MDQKHILLVANNNEIEKRLWDAAECPFGGFIIAFEIQTPWFNYWSNQSVCTKRIYAKGFADFCWQERFHDEIIRDERALNAIRVYIITHAASHIRLS